MVFYLSLLLKLKESFYQKNALIILIMTTAVSFEFYPYQIVSFPLTLIIPFGLIISVSIKMSNNNSPRIINFLITVFSLYLILGLTLSSSSANTWADGPAPNGVFIVSNSLVILNYLFSKKQKQSNLFIVFQLLIGIIGFALIYYITNGFFYGNYDGNNVRLRRNSSIFVCITSLVNALVILRIKTQ